MAPGSIRRTRPEKITDSMTLTSLVQIHDIADKAVTTEQLEAVAQSVALPPPESGRRLEWVVHVVEALAEQGLVTLVSADERIAGGVSGSLRWKARPCKT